MRFLSAPARQRSALEETGHRPWSLPPPASWLMGQSWDNLLFTHWPVAVGAIRPHVPPPLAIDTFEGDAWIGITPFRLHGLRLRSTPPLPFLSSFLELNTRTYVTFDGKPGIWFFSLDASSSLAVAAARRAYRLPYFRARMSATPSERSLAFESERRHPRARVASFRARYRATGERFNAKKGSLEYFLAERYCLYTVEDGEVFRGEIHHRPWPLQEAEAEIRENSMAPPGIDTSGDPLLHLSARQDVVIWPLERA